jgi:hypothetical protein
MEFINWLSLGSGLISAICWYYASVVKVSHKQEVEWRKKHGISNFSGIELDGSDISGSFRVQRQYNCVASIFAGIAIILQGLVNI